MILDGTGRRPGAQRGGDEQRGAGLRSGRPAPGRGGASRESSTATSRRWRAGQLRGWWGSQVDAWRHLRTYRIAHGQPDQSPPFAPEARVALGDGRFVCGDHRDTGSIQGALFSGRRCAEAVDQHLG